MIIKQVPGEGRKQLEIALANFVNNKKVGKVGWFEKSKYPNGTQVAQVAAKQEYGSTLEKIPPRPFMRPTIRAKQNEWSNISFKLAKEVIKGKRRPQDVLELLGLKAAGQIRKTISNLYTPSLAFSTIQGRLRRAGVGNVGRPYTRAEIGNLYKPLIDTGLMYGTLINIVENE